MTRIASVAAAIALLVLQAGCASRSQEVRAVPAAATLYQSFSCEQLHDEVYRIDAQALDAAARVDKRFADNAALILVSGLVWPAALALRADGEQAQRLGMLRGRHEAATQAIASRRCPPPAALPSSERAARLSLWPGDRYVYQLSPPDRTEVVVEVTGVRAERVEIDGGRWAQDLAGNRLPAASIFDVGAGQGAPAAPTSELPHVVGLLEPGLRLGRRSSGVLMPGVDGVAFEARAQVVGTGLATLSQGSLPTATLELEGRLVDGMSGTSPSRETVQGVLVVDSRNGMLVRLQIAASAALPAMDVRLLRVEPSPQRPAPAVDR